MSWVNVWLMTLSSKVDSIKESPGLWLENDSVHVGILGNLPSPNLTRMILIIPFVLACCHALAWQFTNTNE